MIRLCLGSLLILTAGALPSLAQNNGGFAVGEPDPLPAEFRGKVSYFGNHSGEVISMRASRPGGPRRDCPRPDQRCPERIGGSLQVDLEFEGEIVRGAFRGTGGLRDSQLIGRRIGSSCDLYDLADGSMWSGICDGRNFRGAVRSVPNSGVQITLAFQAVGIDVDDFSDGYKEWRKEWMRVRQYDSLRAQVSGGETLEDRFHATVELAAYDWEFDPLVAGSVTNITRSRVKKTTFIQGEFALESGARGWARARYENDSLICIEYWDARACQPFVVPPRPPEPPRRPRETSGKAALPVLPRDEGPSDVAMSLPSEG